MIIIMSIPSWKLVINKVQIDLLEGIFININKFLFISISGYLYYREKLLLNY